MLTPKWKVYHNRIAKRELARIKKILDKKFIVPITLPKTPDNLLDWTTTVRKIQGENFSFQGREYLKQIYSDSNKRIMIVKPRQMEITEFALNWLLFQLDKNPNTVGLYLTDRQKHVSVFSKLRLWNRAIGESPILQSLVIKKGNVSLLSFKNGSTLWMYSAWPDFESARSVPTDFAVVDEIQSTNVEAIPVLEEALSKSRFGKYLYIGTGSVIGDSWWNLWHKGNQQEWDDIKKSWVAKNPDSAISSYHLTQYMASWISRDDISYKRNTYTSRRFVNEVEGYWYGGTSKPLTDSDIRTLFDNALAFTPPEQVDHKNSVFLGVDWGGGTQAYTVAWIWQLVNKEIPRFKLLYVTRIKESSTEKQADMISELIDKYEVDRGVMDAGGGTRQVEKLSNRYGERIFKCTYNARPEEPFELVSGETRINVDRTWIIETLIDLITRPEDDPDYSHPISRIQIPSQDLEEVEWLIDHFTCIESKTVETGGRSRVTYNHPPETNDDALHACAYAYLAWKVNKGEEWHWGSEWKHH